MSLLIDAINQIIKQIIKIIINRMKLTTTQQNKVSNIKPISNVFKLKQLIQSAANPHFTENKENIQAVNLQLTERNKDHHISTINKSGTIIKNKTPRSKSEINQQKQDQMQSSKLQLTNLNLDNLKLNPFSNSVKGSKNIQFKPISVITKSSSNKTISNKKIQGLSKSFRCKTSIREDISIDSFFLGKKLGKGRFGNVYVAQQKYTNFILAIKIINKKQLKQAQMQDQLLSEIKLQSYMKHPNILQMYGVFHDQQNIYLMLQLAQECLFKELRRKTCYSQKQVAYYTKQMIEGLKYLHSQSIIHRDLKPQNIMLVNNVIKIADFGWSVYSPLYKRQTFCGTLDYVPPEIVQGDYYDERVDIWSLGVLIFQLSFGYAPFQGSNTQEQTFQRIINGQFQIPEFVSQSLSKTIQYILIRDPRHRLNLKDIEQTPWLRLYNKQGRSISQDIWDFWQNKRLI